MPVARTRKCSLSLLASLTLACAPPANDDSGDSDGTSTAETSDTDCTPGTEDCECVANECLGSLECVAGVCTSECTPGALGCECVDGQCLGDNLCVDEVCTSPGGDGDGDPTTGDGDGDPTTGDGDGDPTGDGDGDPTTGDGDGDGDPNTCDDPLGALGCEFFAIKPPASMFEWALQITVANPGPEPATIEVEQRIAGDWVMVAGPLIVDPMDPHTFFFYEDEPIATPGKHDGQAYRIRSTAPVGVHQLNGRPAKVGVSNLLPAHAWDHEYELSVPALDGYAVVVATADDTTVQVQPHSPLIVTPDIPLAAEPFQVVLDAGESLGLFDDPDAFMGTITGTVVSSDVAHPLVVFAGGDEFCDHIEEQLLGLSFADQDHIAMRSSPSVQTLDPFQTRFRVYSTANNTSLSVDALPSITGLPPVPTVLAAEQIFDFNPDGPSWLQAGDVRISTSNPSHVFNASRCLGNLFTASMATVTPASALTTRYAFALPEDLPEVVFTVGYPVGTTITFNGAATGPEAGPFEFTDGWMVARYRFTQPSVYLIEGSEPFALNISGDISESRHFNTLGGVGH